MTGCPVAAVQELLEGPCSSPSRSAGLPAEESAGANNSRTELVGPPACAYVSPGALKKGKLARPPATL